MKGHGHCPISSYLAIKRKKTTATISVVPTVNIKLTFTGRFMLNAEIIELIFKTSSILPLHHFMAAEHLLFLITNLDIPFGG